MTIEPSDNPIFILGILPRSGTNLLFNLLHLHPDCGVPEPIWEDYFLEPSHLLLQYTRAVYGWWESAVPPWGVDRSLESLLCQHLGQGLISFLKSQIRERRLLTKTPCVSGLENFFKFFPDAYLLILVRDGRDLVESAARSFGWDRDATTRMWADAARTILSFDQTNRERGLRYLIVRYEDLYLNLDSELRKILAFLDLDAETYDFDKARNLLVRGSSTLGATGDWVHWRPVARTSAFNPIGRWKGWSRRMHERFNWIAGQYLRAFGYEEKSYSEHRQAWTIYNRVVDMVQKYRPYRLMPPFVWRIVKKVGYQLLRLGGVDALDRTYEDV